LRSGGREGARLAPDAVREQFYRLSNFGIHRKILDLGNILAGGTLEEVHDRLAKVSAAALSGGKRIIVLGGGGDISYPDGVAMAEAFGPNRWIGINIDAHFDVDERPRATNETQFRRLLDENRLLPNYFYEMAFQPYYVSPVHYHYLVDLGVKLISLDLIRSRDKADTELRELIRQEFIHHSRTMNVFFAFDLQAVHAADAPGVSAPSPFGLRAGEFLTLVEFAAKLVNTKMIEFTEINPNFDADSRTTKLVAIAMHKFCSIV
jgi:arginase family enzyme